MSTLWFQVSRSTGHVAAFRLVVVVGLVLVKSREVGRFSPPTVTRGAYPSRAEVPVPPGTLATYFTSNHSKTNK